MPETSLTSGFSIRYIFFLIPQYYLGARGPNKGTVFRITIAFYSWLVIRSSKKLEQKFNKAILENKKLEIEVIRKKCREVRFTATYLRWLGFFAKIQKK